MVRLLLAAPWQVTVEIPDSVIYIGVQAFKNCVSLNGELSLPRNLSVLEEESFYGCGGLTGALQLPQNLVQIGDRALYGCSGFTGELAIPDSVESIGHGAFYGMAGIARITFGTGLRAFGGDAYYPTPTMGNMTALQQVAFTGATPPAIENESLLQTARCWNALSSLQQLTLTMQKYLQRSYRAIPDCYRIKHLAIS